MKMHALQRANKSFPPMRYARRDWPTYPVRGGAILEEAGLCKHTSSSRVDCEVNWCVVVTNGEEGQCAVWTL